MKLEVLHYLGGGKWVVEATRMLTILSVGYPACSTALARSGKYEGTLYPSGVTCKRCLKFLGNRVRAEASK